jgi:hypothetical protein
MLRGWEGVCEVAVFELSNVEMGEFVSSEWHCEDSGVTLIVVEDRSGSLVGFGSALDADVEPASVAWTVNLDLAAALGQAASAWLGSEQLTPARVEWVPLVEFGLAADAVPAGSSPVQPVDETFGCGDVALSFAREAADVTGRPVMARPFTPWAVLGDG